MSTPRHRLLLVTSLLLAANPAARASNPIGSTGSVPCATCAKACPLCGDSTSWTQSAIASFDWEILVGLARYPKPTTYSDLAQAAYEKDGNLPTFDQMLGRYFPNSPLQQSQTPLKISQSQISDATFHPSCLFLDSEANIEAVLKKSDAGGEYIHQILTDDAFTLIEPVAATSTPAAGSGWRVRVWKRNAGTLTEKDGDGFYITTSFEAATNTPLKDVTFRHIAGTEIDSNTLTLIHTETENTGTSPRIITQEIVQTVGTGTDANGANGSGKPKKVTSRLFYGDGVGGDHLSTEILDYSAYGAKVWDYTITRSVFTAPMLAGGAIGTLDDTTDTSSDLTSKTVETYQDFSDTAITGGGAMGMKRLVSISRSGELTSYTYVAADPTDPNSGASHGRLKTVTRPDGSWTSYTYSGMGTAPFITEYSSWLDSTSADLGNARKTETSVSGNIFTVRTFIAGQLIAKSQTTLAVGGSMADTLVTTLQWDGTDSPPVGGDMTLSSGNSLTTTTAYFSDAARTSPGRVHWIEHPDGTATTYAYGPDSGNLTTTICTGAGDRGGVTAGTQVDTTYGLGNIPIAESTKDLASDYSIESWITEPATYDPIGRPITRVYNGDTADYDTSIYSCCGLSEFRARDGSTTHYYRDKLKRVYSTTITADSVAGCPVVATNTIISGLTTSQTRSVTLMGPDADSDGKLLPHPSNPVFLGSNTSSLDGLTTTTISPSRSSTDSADRLITRVVTTHNPATGDSETETYQVGAAWIDLAATTTNSTTTHFLDGRTHAVTGDAVTNVTYAYDKHSLKGGGLVTKATVSGLTTSSDTYTDPLGRTLQTVTPAAGTTTYTYNSADFDAGARGKLASVADADCTGTETSVSYGYNTKGERTTTKRTVPTGATPAPTQSTVTATTFINDEVYGYGHCRSTTTTVNDTIVSQSLSVIDTASGFISIISTPTGTSKTVTTRPGATTGAATSTSTRPDGTKTVTTSTHGLTIEVKSQTAPASTISTTTYDYDSLQRLQYVTDSRTGTDGRTEYHEFTESGTPLVTKRAGRTTTNTCDALGRVIQSVLPDNSATHTSYYPTGLVKAQWGSQTYPTLRVYNGQGQLTTLYTYQALTGEPVNATGAAATTWNYSPTTGQLLSKHDATGLGPSYTYTVAGRLKTRTWARGVHTRYDYLYGFHVATRYFTNATADTEINDGNDTDTPDVNTTFDILGRQLAITQTAIKMLGNGPTYPVRSQIEYSYADGTGGDHGISSETISYDFNLDGSFELTRVLDRADRSFGRDMGFTLGTAENHASDQSVSYGYNNAGNVNGVTGAGKVFTYGYAYAQAAGAPRVGVAADPEGAINDFKPYALAAPKHTVIRTYEATRDVLVSIDNKIGTSVSYYIYGVNNLGQRETLNTTGPAFSGLAPNHNWAWQYDALGQITTATCGWDSDLSRTYTFDDIGNRLTATTDSGEDAATTTYTPNSLNQYISINPGTAVTPAYDNDGNLYTDAAVNAIGLGLKFKWDGENRLTAVCKDDEGSTLLASYAYDPIGRRIRKTITSESIRGPSDTAYAYDGWNVVAEYVINGSSATLTQAYTWGLDLSGSLQGAGGVGGLLCIHRGPGTATNGDRTWTDAFYPTFDGNGNVSEYFDKDGTQVAHFEYDPFGRIVNSTGSPENFPYRFSTKPQDFETGLFYYGYRYYNPLTGRWPSRDPMGEMGGMNLYGFVLNRAMDWIDNLGAQPENLPGIGPYAPPGGGVPISPGHGRPSAAEQNAVNALFEENGCHSCGEKCPGTTSGNAVFDHQPSKALGTPTEGYPHCLKCSRIQGGMVRGMVRGVARTVTVGAILLTPWTAEAANEGADLGLTDSEEHIGYVECHTECRCRWLAFKKTTRHYSKPGPWEEDPSAGFWTKLIHGGMMRRYTDSESVSIERSSQDDYSYEKQNPGEECLMTPLRSL